MRLMPISDRLTTSADAGDQVSLDLSWYERSSLFGYGQTVPPLAALAGVLWIIGPADVLLKVFCSALIGLLAYRLTFVVHDCSHRTLFSSKAENEVVGWVVSAILLTSFVEFRRLHWLHHRHYGRPDDPQGTDYNGLVPGRDSVLWHLAKPLLLFNVVEKLSFFLALQHCGMTATERRASEQNPAATLLVRGGSVAAILCAHFVLFVVSTRAGAFLWGYPFALASLPTFALFLSRLRSYLEHGALNQSHGGRLIARTHRSNIVERNLLAAIFFNFHNEHHRWPQVPSQKLQLLHETLTSGRLPPREYSPSYWHSIKELVRESARGRGV
jgi:fatty acid desaturase